MEESDLINQLRDIVGNEAIAPDVDFDHAALRDKLPLATCALFSFDSVLLFGNRTLFVRPTASIKPEILLSERAYIVGTSGTCGVPSRHHNSLPEKTPHCSSCAVPNAGGRVLPSRTASHDTIARDKAAPPRH